jgi:sulfate adenylyltransferase large subunit
MAAPQLTDPEFAIEGFLESEARKQLLRFSTAGSVDDGKSTLIGRLLYDSRAVYEDQIRAVAAASAHRNGGAGRGALDLSLLTDGLRAEREQGITIDVAYRYFATARRKFIIADTPGHEQYTRNMATGASTADLAIILLDARNGVLPQSCRHACIASLMGIPHFVVAVNKMDLAGYDRAVFERIRAEFDEFLGRLGAPEAVFIPISALHGDNVVARSLAMPWYHGPSLLEHLETVDLAPSGEPADFRFPVQRVIRPDAAFRGYAGQIASGSIRPGDEVTIFPGGRVTRVTRITTFDGDLDEAQAPQSVTLTLEDEIDISRGDLIAAGEPPSVAQRIAATLVWFDERALEPGRRYVVKHGTQAVAAEVVSIRHLLNVATLATAPADSLAMNQIGVVEMASTRPLFFDPYAANPRTGCFVVIDPDSNATAAAGMISAALDTPGTDSQPRRTAVLSVWHDEAVAALRRAGFKVLVEP